MDKPKTMASWGRSKARERYAVGGIIPKRADEDETYEEFLKGYEEEREKELPQYRHKSIDKNAEDTGDTDVGPEDYLVPEDRDT